MSEEIEEADKRSRRQQRRNARAARLREEKKRAEAEEALAATRFPGIPSPEKMREDFWEAFHDLGGKEGLVEWGRRYPKEFYAIWARICVPKESATTPTGGSLEDMLSQLGDDDE